MNQRRPWLQRFRRRLPNLLPTLLLTVLYLAGAVHLALQHCRLTSLFCLLAAAATVAVKTGAGFNPLTRLGSRRREWRLGEGDRRGRIGRV